MKLDLVRDDNLKLTLDKKLPLFLTDVQGLDGVPITNYKYTLPNQDGSNYISTVIGERTLSIYFTFKHNTERLRRQVLQFFNPRHEITIQIDGKYMVKGRTTTAPVFSLEGKYNRCLVIVECMNPYITDLAPSTFVITTVTPMLRFPWRVNNTKMGRKDENLIADIINNGDIPTGFVIEFNALGGTVTTPGIVNMTTREEIKVQTLLNKGEKLRINTTIGERTVEFIKNNTVVDAFELISDDFNFIQLPIGKNSIRYTAEEGINNLSVTMVFNNKYLGI